MNTQNADKPPQVDQNPAKYPVSDVRSIDSLIVSASHAKEQVQNLKSLHLNALRHVRGDGNCFYRAVGFYVMELLCCSSSPLPLPKRKEKLRSTLFPPEEVGCCITTQVWCLFCPRVGMGPDVYGSFGISRDNSGQKACMSSFR